MGSTYFYLEFLLAWITLLQQSGFRNPAIVSVEYSLVPDAIYPTQLNQCLATYRYVASIMNGRAENVCVAGDSAGGTLILSLLLYLQTHSLEKPGLAILISPWVTIVSHLHINTASDYLDVKTLHQYGAQYLDNVHSAREDVIASPGHCKDLKRLKNASPTHGFIIAWGREEMLHMDIQSFVVRLEKAGVNVQAYTAKAGIHAWPVAALYLGEDLEKRLSGLRDIVNNITVRLSREKR